MMFLLFFTAANLVVGMSTLTLEERIKHAEDVNGAMVRHVMLQQFYNQEMVRSRGDSGLLSVRLSKAGNKNYFNTAHFQRGYIAVHEHANYDRTVGLGELNLVMNGVQFRTRHNDYKMHMPHRTSKTYHEWENIPFPPVPQSVLDKPTVEEEMQEMREYFRAFKAQNVSHRDYKPYFKANLCYIEGGWTKASKDLDEPFPSDRHQLDASSWFDLMEKSQFTAYTGTKSVKENFAFLPTMIYSIENGQPKYAQWNYRIMCHPIKREVPTTAIKGLEDLLNRMTTGETFEMKNSGRRGRFTVQESDEDDYTNPNSLLDQIMMEIPGKDNYQAKIHDRNFGRKYFNADHTKQEELNTGYYHRYYKTKGNDGVSEQVSHRGFNDANLWMAQTTQDKIACLRVKNCNSTTDVCEDVDACYTYALPLEVIYLTPLSSWNPYGLLEEQKKVRPRDRKPGVVYDITERRKRNGSPTEATAYLGFNYKVYYKTPKEFYKGKVAGDVADTAKFGIGVLDQNRTMRLMASTGMFVSTPEIVGVGRVRMRYPILPIHAEGSGAWKELNALKEMVMKQKKYSHLYDAPPCQCKEEDIKYNSTGHVHLGIATTSQTPPGQHSHDIWVSRSKWTQLMQNGISFTTLTNPFEGHTHDIEVSRNLQGQAIITKCDGMPKCWDGHSSLLQVLRA